MRTLRTLALQGKGSYLIAEHAGCPTQLFPAQVPTNPHTLQYNNLDTLDSHFTPA